MSIVTNADPTESRLDDMKGMVKEQTSDDFLEEGDPEDKPLFDDAELLAFLGDAKRRSRTYQQTVVMGMWEQAEAAYRSEHGPRSKYLREQYKNRARYFKPKSRVAVRKNLTATMNALFASQNVISCEATDDSNDLERANAALIRELLNARLNNKTIRAGVPWFQTVLGARQQTQISGVVCSKQSWSYRCVEKPVTTREEQPVLDPASGQPLIGADGQPMVQVVETAGTKKDIVVDKPTVTLIPSEMVLIDPSTDWINPAQLSPTLIVIWPMHVDDVRSMMSEEKGHTPWRQVEDADLKGAMYSESELMGLKTAREGNAATAVKLSTTRFGGMGGEIVEVRENFFRREGRDYQVWSLKDSRLLSDPKPTEEVYPEFRGSRPVVIGTDALEAHVLYPESHVASWRQAQDEINDFSNIRMDGARQSVYPVAKVIAGKGVDYKAVQRRDQQGIILVREQTDVMFDRPQANTMGVDREVQLLSNDFDELAGIFSQNSVQSNRQIGDTVGGMQLIAANANATSEFDLRCFIETWVEPVLSQLVMLEQFFEDDVTILAVSGQKAKLFERFGVSDITDELLESQVQLSVGGGSGGSDPMQKLIRFKSTMDIAQPMLALAMQQGKAEINFEEVFSEIFSQAGYKNGAERFIKLNDQVQPPIPPEKVQQLMQMMQQVQQENQQLKGDKAQQQQTEIAKTTITQQGETQRTMLTEASKKVLQDDQQQHDLVMAGLNQLERNLILGGPVRNQMIIPLQ